MKPIHTIVAALLLATQATPHAAGNDKPNVIFILTDDQGWGDAHFAGHPYLKTPSLDKFASQGTWLRQFYVAATVCSPSVWTLLPHALLKPTPEQLAVYADLAPNSTDPAFGPWTHDYLDKAKKLKQQMQVYCASITDLDTQMGRLFAALDEMKLADNTVIFFSSDNGPEDYRIGNAANAGVGSAGPLRARKRSMYEGGSRTFGLVRWPGHVPAGRRDESSVTGAVDFLPTVCKLAGVDVPSSIQPDGEDVSDIWLGKSRPRTKPLHWEWLFNVAGGKGGGYMPPMLAVRDGDWKLFVNHSGTGAQLYNIPKDIGEEHDLAAENPEVVKTLTANALDWTKSLPSNPGRIAAEKTGQPQDRKGAGNLPKKKAASGTHHPL